MTAMATQTVLTRAALARGVRELLSREPAFERIVWELGPPPLWARRPGFPSLLFIVLEQQVSLASARAAFKRLEALACPVTPKTFLELEDATLRSIGFSRQKTSYGRNIARAILSGSLELAALPKLDDESARRELIRIKGIGVWTADIYLLRALRRPDVWPCGDLALAVAARDVLGLQSLPTVREMELIGLPWRPWRSVAARILWHFYLDRGRGAQIKTRSA